MSVLPRLLASLALIALAGCSTLSGLFPGEPAETPSSAEAAAEARMVVSYELEVDAPRELRAMLLEHLDLARFQRTDAADRLSSVELDRLSASTPAQVRALLETAGYFNPTVLLSREPGTPEKVRVQVTPGPRTLVTKLEFNFSGPLQAPLSDPQPPLQQSLRREWALPVGELFSQSAWSSAKTAALSRARSGGYPLARWADTSARVDAQVNSVELGLLLDSGPLFKLGELRIEGLKYQSEDTVRRLAGFTPGEPYTERMLLDFQERLLKTQLFDAVSVEIEPESKPDPAQDQVADVFVRLRESPRQQATTGIGYNANTGQRITLEHLHRAPFGLPLRAKSKLDLGRDLRAASVELTSHPQNDMQRNLASMQLEEDRSGDQVVTNLSARIGRLRETARDDRLIYAELLRAHETAAGSSVTSAAASLNTQWIRRRLDNLLLPTDGHQALLLIGAGRAQNSASASGAFGRAQFKLGWFKPVGDRWYASARVELGQVLAADRVGIPEKLLFRAGGDDSVRGYAYNSLGPIRNGGAVGGRVLGTSSIEIARPILPSQPAFWGAAFIDAGQAADSWRGFKPALGYGVGLRWRSPVGPLRVDVARGEELKRWRLHFSVGIAL